MKSKFLNRPLVLVTFLCISFLAASCDSLSGYLWYRSLKPESPFEETDRPKALDYSELTSWAAHPSVHDNSDVSVSGKTPLVRERDIDVFYVHPTTYHSPESWNQPPHNQHANALTDNWVLLNQAGLFSDCCDVYVPRYRQATLYAILSDEADADKALELAYQDVKAAFTYYLNHHNRGRPFIIASHSQGSWHALRLTEELIASSPLKEQLVVAYLIGMPLPADKLSTSLKDVPVCNHATQNRCLVSWNSVTDDADTHFYYDVARVWYGDHYQANQDKELVCVNPLTWSVNDAFGHPSLNKGGINFKQNRSVQPPLDTGVVGSRCLNGMLYITKPTTQNYEWLLFGEGNYHMHDYDLFYANIKENVQARIQAYLANSISVGPSTL